MTTIGFSSAASSSASGSSGLGSLGSSSAARAPRASAPRSRLLGLCSGTDSGSSSSPPVRVASVSPEGGAPGAGGSSTGSGSSGPAAPRPGAAARGGLVRGDLVLERELVGDPAAEPSCSVGLAPSPRSASPSSLVLVRPRRTGAPPSRSPGGGRSAVASAVALAPRRARPRGARRRRAGRRSPARLPASSQSGSLRMKSVSVRR